jgi:phosphatidylglycerophosphatase C
VSDVRGASDRVVAAFDFDGTLTRRDSLLPFVARVATWPRTLAVAARVSPRLGLASMGRADRDDAKARFLTPLLRGRLHSEVSARGVAYGDTLVDRAIRPEMRARVAWHRAQGHEVVIVSASLDVYLDRVGQLLDVQGVLCTRLEIDDDGRCTGRMLGGNCRGSRKAERLRDYLGELPVELWAYGDSGGDTEMLAMADHVSRARRGRLLESV